MNTFKTLGLAALILLAGFGRPALAEALKAGDSVEPARQLIAQLRAELQPVDDQIAHAPFLTALERHVIQDGLNRGANPRDIRRAARLLQDSALPRAKGGFVLADSGEETCGTTTLSCFMRCTG